MDDKIIRGGQSEDVEALANLMTELGYITTPYTVRTDYTLKVRFAATLGKEPEIELAGV